MYIAVVCGGLSRERDVSISTGTGVARALRELGHSVALVDLFLGCPYDPSQPRVGFTAENRDAVHFVGEAEPDLDALRAKNPGSSLLGPGVIETCRAADFTFLALHGSEGENGQLQACLDMHGIPYTGSGYIGSALAMNKELSKVLFRHAGIPTPPGATIRVGESVPAQIGFPCVVKPCSGGSSVGTSIVQDKEHLEEALSAAFACEDHVLVESYIRGREFTCGVMDGKAMAVIEIIPKTGFYDYKNKYQAGLTVELCPAPLPEEETKRIQRLSEQVFEALHLAAYGRVDLLMDDNGQLYCLEANTLPGMTPTSLIPQMAAVEGLSYGQLCEKIIEVSRKKYEK